MSRLAECRHEADLVAAVTSGRWPAAVDQALREHVASCAVCADVLQVAEAMTALEQETLADTRLPAAGQVWWRAQVRARHEAAAVAARPVMVAQAARRRRGAWAGGRRRVVEVGRDCDAWPSTSGFDRLGRRGDGGRAGPAGDLRRRPGVGAGLRPAHCDHDPPTADRPAFTDCSIAASHVVAAARAASTDGWPAR